MSAKYLHSMIGLYVILSYLVAVILAKKPLNKEKFKKYFKILIILKVIFVIFMIILPGGDEYVYRESLISLIITAGGCVLHISARRYMEIGGNRWNCFVPYIHFSEFIRLWWESPVPKYAKIKGE